MEIRTASTQDISQLVALGREAHAESPRYSHYKFDAQRAADFAASVLENAWALALVAVKDDRIVGALIGVVTPHFFTDAMFASDLFFYVEKEARGTGAGVRLMKEWERTVKGDGRIAETVLGISSEINSQRTQQLYERLGYRTAGYLMVKEYE